MRSALKLPSWFVIGVGVLMTAYFARDLQPSWLVPLALWMLVPYGILFKTIRAARSSAAGVVALLAGLGVVCIGFSIYFDRKFVHLTGIDHSPLEVPFWQLLAAVGGWVAVRRLQKTSRNEPTLT